MSLRRFILGSVVSLVTATAFAQSLNEGPHVFWQGKEARVVEVREGKVVESKLSDDGTLVLPGVPAIHLRPDGYPPAWPSGIQDARNRGPLPGRILALSDVHGNIAGLRNLLLAHRVMDEKGVWSFGKGHLVIVGDILDRGAGVTEALWLVRSLQEQAQEEGGGVHFLLGNHEVMVMRGDTRYAHPQFQTLQAQLGRDASGLVAADTELGRWLRSCPVVVPLGSTLFVHGGISPGLLAKRMAPALLNEALRAELVQSGTGDLLGGDGPLWFRGLIPGVEKKPPEASPQDVEAILKLYKVKQIVIGHTTLPQATAFHGGKVYGIDAGLKDGKPGEVWIWDEGKVWRGLADGSRVPFEAPALPKAAGQ